MSPIREVDPTIRVTVITSAGAGSRVQLDVSPGTTLADIAEDRGLATRDNVARVNNAGAPWTQECQNGDVISFSPLKAPGA